MTKLPVTNYNFREFAHCIVKWISPATGELFRSHLFCAQRHLRLRDRLHPETAIGWESSEIIWLVLHQFSSASQLITDSERLSCKMLSRFPFQLLSSSERK